MKNALANERMVEISSGSGHRPPPRAGVQRSTRSDEIRDEGQEEPDARGRPRKRFQLIEGMEDPAKDTKAAGLQNFSTFMALAKANEWVDGDGQLKTGIEQDKDTSGMPATTKWASMSVRIRRP